MKKKDDPLFSQYLAYQALLLDYFWFPSPESARLIVEFQFSTKEKK